MGRWLPPHRFGRRWAWWMPVRPGCAGWEHSDRERDRGASTTQCGAADRQIVGERAGDEFGYHLEIRIKISGSTIRLRPLSLNSEDRKTKPCCHAPLLCFTGELEPSRARVDWIGSPPCARGSADETRREARSLQRTRTRDHRENSRP